MCANCDFDWIIERIDEMVNDDRHRFAWAYDTLTGIKETITQNGHVTEKQAAAVANRFDEEAVKRIIKVYACSDEEWVAACSAKSALRFYLSETGIDFKYDMDSEMPTEVCESEMARLLYIEDCQNVEQGEKKPFRVKLAEMVKDKKKFPCWFAISDY